MIKKNYTVMFMMFFVASIAVGLALTTIFEYSMTVGVSLGIVFLLCSAFSAVKNNQNLKA